MIWAMAALIVILAVLVWVGNLRLMLGFLATGIVVIGLLLVFDVFEERRSASLIDPGQVELIGFDMQLGHASVYEFQGRVQNNSPDYGLFRLGLRVLAQDCPVGSAEASQCTVIGEKIVRLGVDVPAGQARDVSERIRFATSPLTPRGELRWQFEVVATDGG